MARSMTGFGQSELVRDDLRCACRLKSVNNRFLQISLRTDPTDEELETAVRRLVQESVTRGSLDITIKVQQVREGSKRITFNSALFEAIRPTLEQTSAQITLDGLVRTEILEISTDTCAEDAGHREALMGCLREALRDWDRSRETEGAALIQQMLGFLGELEQAVDRIAALDCGRLEAISSKLRSRMIQLLDGQAVTEQRLIEEAAYLAQRSDITEEMDRLKSHFTSLRTLLTATGGDAVGKRIEFLLQEMLRELNTLGSKSQSAQISGLAVDAKVLLEKLKQQSANIE